MRVLQSSGLGRRHNTIQLSWCLERGGTTLTPSRTQL